MDASLPPALPSPSNEPKQLTEMQLDFIHFLAMDKRANAKKAAMDAGIDERNAATQAWKWLSHPDYTHVRKAYDELVNARMAAYHVTEESLIRELSAIAYADKRHVVRWGPNGVQVVTDSEDLWPEEVAQVKSMYEVDTEDGPRIKFSFYSKADALVALCKIRGMLREKSEGSLDIRIQSAARRAAASLQALIEREAEEDPQAPPPGSEGSGR